MSKMSSDNCQRRPNLSLMMVKDNSLYQQLIFSDFVPYESFVLDVQSSDDEQDMHF